MAESYSIQAVLSAVDKNFSSTMKDAAGASDDLDSGVKKSNTSIMDIAKGVGVFKVLEVGMNAVTNSVGAAVSRFDTLNQYPKVLQSLGASAEDSDKGIKILSDGIDGLPTKLDEVAATSQQMFLVFRDADKASQSTIALNNALLASGSSGDKAARGTEAYLKMLRSGKVDMDTWMSLQDTMGIGLDKVAKNMLGAEASTTDLYKALQSGQISIDDFNGALVGMSDELGDLARVNTKGIGTSFSNMANAISKGVGNSIQALDDLVKASGINADGIAGIFDVLKAQINNAFTTINKAIVSTAPYISQLISVLGKLTPMLPILATAAAGVGVAFVTWKVINSVNNWIGKMNGLVGVARVSIDAYSLSVKTGATRTIAFEAAQKATNSTTKKSTILYGLLSGQIKATEVAQMSLAKASVFLQSATGALTIGLTAVAAIGATVAWAYKEQTKETKELKDKTDEMASSLKESAKEQETSAKNSVKQTSETLKLKNEIFNLAAQENKSLEQKELLSQKTEELNKQVEGLKLSYDGEKNSLSMSNEEAQKRIELQGKIQAGEEAKEKLPALYEKQRVASENLLKAETTLQKQQQEGVMFEGQRREAEDAKVKGIQHLNDIENQIAAEDAKRKEGEKAALEKMVRARNAMVEQGKIDYQSLSDTQKAAFDSMQTEYDSLRNSATSAFEEIDQTTKFTAESMINTLQKNQEATNNWKTNLDNLYGRAAGSFDTEFINKLESEGIAKNAGVMQMLANSSDEELKRISELYKQNGQLATDVYSKQIGEGGAKIAEGLEKSFQDANPTANKLATDSGLAQLGKDISNKVVLDLSNSSKAVDEAAKTMIGPVQDLKPKLESNGKDAVGGLGKGIISAIPDLEKPSNNMADKVNDTFKTKMDIHSPSRVMADNGGFIVSGLVKGIDQNQGSVSSAVNSLAEKVKEPFANLPNAMQSLGYNAGIGFANGLSSASGSIYDTANSIANNVASTIQKALDIHSPSRVMRTLGSFVGQGLALGMEDSEKYVINASDTLARATMPDLRNNFDGAMGGDLGTAAEIHLMLGGSDFRAFVDDISNAQQSSIRLEKVW